MVWSTLSFLATVIGSIIGSALGAIAAIFVMALQAVIFTARFVVGGALTLTSIFFLCIPLVGPFIAIMPAAAGLAIMPF